jgi:hypothetical protein
MRLGVVSLGRMVRALRADGTAAGFEVVVTNRTLCAGGGG